MNQQDRTPRGAFTILEVLVVVLILAVLAAILLPVLYRPVPDNRRNRCQSNLKLMGLGFLQYTQDFGECFPPVKLAAKPMPSRAYGWADAIQPYHGRTDIYQCPTETTRPKHGAVTDPQYTDYWYNAQLSRRNTAKIGPASETFLAGDGNDGKEKCDARYSIRKLPAAWRTTEHSPALRHLDGANYLFTDGHVKWLHLDRVLDGASSFNAYGFAPGEPLK